MVSKNLSVCLLPNSTPIISPLLNYLIECYTLVKKTQDEPKRHFWPWTNLLSAAHTLVRKKQSKIWDMGQSSTEKIPTPQKTTQANLSTDSPSPLWIRIFLHEPANSAAVKWGWAVLKNLARVSLRSGTGSFSNRFCSFKVLTGFSASQYERVDPDLQRIKSGLKTARVGSRARFGKARNILTTLGQFENLKNPLN